MIIRCLSMPLLTELGEWEMDFCYKQVAPNGALISRPLCLRGPHLSPLISPPCGEEPGEADAAAPLALNTHGERVTRLRRSSRCFAQCPFRSVRNQRNASIV
jgi:hypothetical protein